jgi:hypothetical protein
VAEVAMPPASRIPNAIRDTVFILRLPWRNPSHPLVVLWNTNSRLVQFKRCFLGL